MTKKSISPNTEAFTPEELLKGSLKVAKEEVAYWTNRVAELEANCNHLNTQLAAGITHCLICDKRWI